MVISIFMGASVSVVRRAACSVQAAALDHGWMASQGAVHAASSLARAIRVLYS